MIKYKNIISEFNNKKIAVIGDIMLDKYVFGIVERISPEAPIPIVAVEKERFVPGGAANVAANIASLGGKPILFGIAGEDENRNILFNRLKRLNINYKGIEILSEYPTIVKIRIIGHNQQLLRIDYEKKVYIDKNTENKILNGLKKHKDVEAIIISDYAKGCITESLIQNLKQISKNENIPLIIDPKPKHKAWYENAYLITPNRKEAEEMSGIKITTENDYITAGNKLRKEFSSNIIITASEKGMYVFEKGKQVKHIQTQAQEVADVSGAGDTVVATLALALSSNADMFDSAMISSLAAGITVSKLGTAQVKISELIYQITTN